MPAKRQRTASKRQAARERSINDADALRLAALLEEGSGPQEALAALWPARVARWKIETLRSYASEVCRQPAVIAHRERLQEERRQIARQQFAMGAREVLAEEIRRATFDPLDFYEWIDTRQEYRAKRLDELTPEQRRCIAEIEEVNVPYEGAFIRKFRFVDRNKAAERLNKMLGLYEPENRAKMLGQESESQSDLAERSTADLERELREIRTKQRALEVRNASEKIPVAR